LCGKARPDSTVASGTFALPRARRSNVTNTKQGIGIAPPAQMATCGEHVHVNDDQSDCNELPLQPKALRKQVEPGVVDCSGVMQPAALIDSQTSTHANTASLPFG
jgi:hypothetical protein